MKAFHEVRSYSSDIMIWHRSFSNIGFLAHWHEEIELIYIRKGCVTLSIMDYTFTASEGDLMICNSGEIHYCESNGKENILDFIVFDPSLISPIYNDLSFSHPHIHKKVMQSLHLDTPLFKLMSTIDSELKDKKPYYVEIIKSNLREFWFLLKRNIPVDITGKTQYHNRSANLLQFQQLLSHIEEHYAEPINLTYLSDLMNFSTSHFSKLFKKLTGIQPITYINTIRIEKAALKIRNTNLKLTAIAFNCGFNNIRSFNRVFKQITGFTPSEFKNLSDNRLKDMTCFNRRSHKKCFVETEPITIVKQP